MNDDRRDLWLEQIYSGVHRDSVRDEISRVLVCEAPGCQRDVQVAVGALRFSATTGAPLIVRCRVHKRSRREALASGLPR